MGEEQQATTGARQAAADHPRLARSADRRLLAGVCTGLGRHTGIDPVVFRVGFAVLVLAHGQGVLLYIAAALLMPASPDEPALAEQLFKRWFDAAGVLSILGALLAAGVAFGVIGGGSTDAIAMLVVFVLVLLVAHSRGVDLVAAARAVPERLAGHPPEPSAGRPRPETGAFGGVDLTKAAPGPAATGPSTGPSAPASSAAGPSATGLPEGMIDLAAYSGAFTENAPAKPRPRHGCGGSSPAATITVLLAMAAGAAMLPVAGTYPAPDSWLIVMAPALAVIGFGAVLGGWVRTRGLATAGTVLTLTMLTTSVAGDVMPRGAEYGDVAWRPTDASRTHQVYRVGVGHGRLDLTALPVSAGQSVTIDATVTMGGLEITVPEGARVLVDAKVTLGDVSIGKRTTGGPNAKVSHVLEPEGDAVRNPPVIHLRIRGKIGDVDVNRG